MRFNDKDVSRWATRSSEEFEREGVLFVRERQETILDLFIAQPEVFVERWCRLRGNLLVYFKGREPTSDPAGVFVLERFDIQFFPSCELPHHFVLSFDDDDRLQYFAAPDEPQRDAWIEALHLAPYECLRTQAMSLRAEVVARSGRRPAVERSLEEPAASERMEGPGEEPVLELLVACEGLSIDGDGRAPNPVVVVNRQSGEEEDAGGGGDGVAGVEWLKVGQTEIQTGVTDPCFLVTVPVFDVARDDRFQVVVLDVRERVTLTCTRIGGAEFRASDLIAAPGETLRRQLKSGVHLPIPRKIRRHSSRRQGAVECFVNGAVVVRAWRADGAERIRGLEAVDLRGFDEWSEEEEEEEEVEEKRKEEETDDDAEVESSVGVVVVPASDLRNPVKTPGHLLETLKGYAANVATKTFRFPSRDETQLCVRELMGESRILTDIPKQLLRLWIDEELDKVDELKQLGSLPVGWESVRVDLIQSRLQLVHDYEVAASDVESLLELTLKPTSAKRFQEYEFFATNLHSSCVWVENRDARRLPIGVYDVCTAASFCAAAQGFARGGLRRILESVVAIDGGFGRLSTRDILRRVDGRSTEGIRETLKKMEELKGEVEVVAGLICQAANKGSPHEMYSLRTTLSDKTRQLTELCDHPFLVEAVRAFDDAKAARRRRATSPLVAWGVDDGGGGGGVGGGGVGGVLEGGEELSLTQMSVAEFSAPVFVTTASQIPSDLKTTISAADAAVSAAVSAAAPLTASNPSFGTRFSASAVDDADDEEPFEITRVNAEASLVCVDAKIEELVRGFAMNPEDAVVSMTTWLPQVAPMLLKLRVCVNAMADRAARGLAFATVTEHSRCFHSRRRVQHRRDVCFSQALTSLVSAFVLKIRLNILDEDFLKQIHQIGVLASFESLLSCYAEEVAMLEDVVVAVGDLNSVAFKLEEGDDDFDLQPVISGSRQNLTVSIPIPPPLFAQLPREMQRGKLVRVVAVLFNIGVDRGAAVAERPHTATIKAFDSSVDGLTLIGSLGYSMITRYIKQPEFGDTSLQEMINKESLETLCDYYEKFAALTGFPDGGRNPWSSSLSLPQLLQLLRRNVASRRSKNVDVLNLASQIGREINALKVTTCVNGRDRTGMAVTLQQCHLLQLRHDLDPAFTLDVLEAMRSDGVRILNAEKNLGRRKFGFDAAEIPALPKNYRPPPGTYAGSE